MELTPEQVEESERVRRADYEKRGLIFTDPRTMPCWPPGGDFIDQDAMNELAGYGPEE